MCNRVHLHIVSVLLYSVCRSVTVLSYVDVIQSFTYHLHVIILDIIKKLKKRRQSPRESDRRHPLLLIHTTRQEEYLAVARLSLPTSNLLLLWTVCR